MASVGKLDCNVSLDVESSSSQLGQTASNGNTEVESPDSGDGPLCGRCAAVDFDAALSSEQEATLIENLGPVKEWSISSCKLCGLLASLIYRESRAFDFCSLCTTNSRNIDAYAHLPFLETFPPKMLLG